MNPSSFWILTPAIALWGLLAAAVWHDVRRRRIPNRLVFAGAALGVLLNCVTQAGAGLWLALGGLLLGLGLLLPMYMLKALGAGDVKLMAMVGAFLGPQGVLLATLCSLLAGAVLALGVALYRGSLRQVLANSWHVLLQGVLRVVAGGSPRLEAPAAASGRLPYAVAVASGTAICLALA